MINKIIQFVKDNKSDIVLIIGIILISLISFGAGRITGTKIQNSESQSKMIGNLNRFPATPIPTLTPESIEIKVIGNKNSKLYHYPWCSGAKNMKEENKVFFDSIEEAKNAGYKPASNCAGL